MARNECCTDENIAFKLALSGGAPADGAPLDSYLQDIIGVSEGNEGNRLLPEAADECGNPHLTFAVGVKMILD